MRGTALQEPTNPLAAPAAEPRPGAAPTVAELMTPTESLVTLTPESSLRDAAAVLSERHLVGAPVLAGGTVVGVLSAADLVDFAAAAPEPRQASPGEPEWEEWRSWEDPDALPSAFFLEMPEPEDLADSLAELSSGSRFEEYTVAEVMTRRLVSVLPAGTAREAAQAMLAASVHRLLVMEDGALRGMITTTDLVRAIAEGRLGQPPE